MGRCLDLVFKGGDLLYKSISAGYQMDNYNFYLL